MLIEAAAALPDGVIVDIAGDGPARPELEALAARRVPGRVRFHGRLDKPRLHELIRSAAVVAVPSRWHENQPMAVLEAFACGVPVVATDLGGLPELVEPEVDGRIVAADAPTALGDALQRPPGRPGPGVPDGPGRSGEDRRPVRPGPAPGPDPWAVRGGRRGAAVAARAADRWGSGPVSPVRVLYLAGSGRSGSTAGDHGPGTVAGLLRGRRAAVPVAARHPGEPALRLRRAGRRLPALGPGARRPDRRRPGRDRRPVGPAAAAARAARAAAPPASGAAAGRGPPRRHAAGPALRLDRRARPGRPVGRGHRRLLQAAAVRGPARQPARHRPVRPARGARPARHRVLLASPTPTGRARRR